MIRHENKDGNRRLSPTRSDSSASNCLAKTERRAPPDGASEAQVGGREVEVLQGIGSGLGRSHAEDGRHGARKINRPGELGACLACSGRSGTRLRIGGDWLALPAFAPVRSRFERDQPAGRGAAR